MTRAQFFGICLGLTLAIVVGGHERKSTPAVEAVRQALTVREAPDRVLLVWSGPVETAMRDALVVALNRFRADPRRLVVGLNSPGGSIPRGREVMAAIREAAQRREIDTLIDKGAVCASMCVPIYLLGTKRTADPDALFMFHQVALDRSAAGVAGHGASPLDPVLRSVIETAATDAFFDIDLRGRGVNAHWLATIRSRIEGHEIWMNGRQLFDEGSGVIDDLVPTMPK